MQLSWSKKKRGERSTGSTQQTGQPPPPLPPLPPAPMADSSPESPPKTVLHRHSIEQSISVLDLKDCAKEVSRLEALEKSRKRKGVELSPIVHSLIEVLRRERKQGAIEPEDETQTDQCIRDLRLDEMDIEQARQWDKEKKSGELSANSEGAQGKSDRPNLAAPQSDSTSVRETVEVSAIRSYVLSATYQPQRAAKIEDSLAKDAQKRCFDYLFKLDIPSRTEDQQVLDDVKHTLQRGLRAHRQERQAAKQQKRGDDKAAATKGKASEATPIPGGFGQASTDDAASRSADALANLARRLAQVYNKEKFVERDIEVAFAALLNGIPAYVNQKRYSDAVSRQDGTKQALYLCVSHKPLKHNQASSGYGHDGTDKPDIVCYEEPVAWDGTAQHAYEGVRTWGEIKRMDWQDLDKDLFRQHLRHAYRVVTNNPMCGRQVGFTLCGRSLRLWVFDSKGYSCLPAIDVTDDADDNALALAQACLFLTGPSPQVQQRWTPDADEVFFVDIPESTPSKNKKGQQAPGPRKARLQVQGKLRFLKACRLSGLWGRRTSVFGDAKAIYTEGYQLPNGDFQPTGAPRLIDLVLKLTWLPEEILTHEHHVLRHLQDKNVQGIPRSLGSIELRSEWQTFAKEQRSPMHYAQDVEFKAAKLHLLAMALESPTGVPIEYGSMPFDVHVRIFRSLVAKLYEVAKCEVHYRDLNLGSIMLRPDWQQRLTQDRNANVLLLIDFGNARIGDQPRIPSAAQSKFGSDLGLEDALSVNGLFMPCSAVKRLNEEADLQELLQRPTETAEQVQRKTEQISDIRATISNLGHRYPDDIESAFYCFLVQIMLLLRDNPSFDAEMARNFEDKVVFGIIDNKEQHWEDANKLQRTLEIINRVVPTLELNAREGFIKALKNLRDHVWDAQPSLRQRVKNVGRKQGKQPAKKPVKIVTKEKKAYANTMKALDDWIKVLSTPALTSPAASAPTPTDAAGKRRREDEALTAKKSAQLDVNERVTLPPELYTLADSSGLSRILQPKRSRMSLRSGAGAKNR